MVGIGIDTMFGTLRSKNYMCWICLDEKCVNDDWIAHQCGCNLEVHRKCLVGWIYDLNKSKLGKYYTHDTYKINSSVDIERRICYLLDKNREFSREIGLAETVQDIPILGQTWATIICVGDLIIRAAARLKLPDELFQNNDLWRGLPEEIPSCPQCKSKILKDKRALECRPSFLLSVFAHFRNAVRYCGTLVALHANATNPMKYLFKVGLWQLRCLFNEKSLRKILEISNTKALDVYGETTRGILSLTTNKKILIMGFPVFLFTFNSSGIYAYAFKVFFPWLLLKNVKANKLCSDAITAHNLAIAIFNVSLRPLAEKLYEKWIRDSEPYFLPKTRPSNAHPGSASFRPSEVSSFSDILIKSQWYDTMLASLLWPYTSSFVGQTLAAHNPLLNSWLLKRYPSASSDDCNMVYTLVCSFCLYAAYELFHLGVSYQRVKELLKIQDIVASSHEDELTTE